MKPKLPIVMVDEACRNLGVIISVDDEKLIANNIPSDIPWTEEGMGYVEGMVRGFQLGRKKIIKE